MTLEFFMPMAKVPTATQQEKQVRMIRGKPVIYEQANVKAARTKLTAHLAQHKPDKPLAGAVRLVARWCFPLAGRHQNGEYKTSRPDTDNLQKLLKDCMTAVGFWNDDAQVSSELVEKFWSEIPGIYIRVEEIAPLETCQTCDGYEDDCGVCCNGESEYFTDFTAPDFHCPQWESAQE